MPAVEAPQSSGVEKTAGVGVEPDPLGAGPYLAVDDCAVGRLHETTRAEAEDVDEEVVTGADVGVRDHRDELQELDSHSATLDRWRPPADSYDDAVLNAQDELESFEPLLTLGGSACSATRKRSASASSM